MGKAVRLLRDNLQMYVLELKCNIHLLVNIKEIRERKRVQKPNFGEFMLHGKYCVWDFQDEVNANGTKKCLYYIMLNQFSYIFLN